MLDYVRQRAIEVLKVPRRAVLATSGPAGVQVSEFPCEAIELELFFLVPQTSDHLFNLEHVSTVSVLTDKWELIGEAQNMSSHMIVPGLKILQQPETEWSTLVKVSPCKLQIRREQGWGNVETIDITSP
jgi:hypothetical protein